MARTFLFNPEECSGEERMLLERAPRRRQHHLARRLSVLVALAIGVWNVLSQFHGTHDLTYYYSYLWDGSSPSWALEETTPFQQQQQQQSLVPSPRTNFTTTNNNHNSSHSESFQTVGPPNPPNKQRRRKRRRQQGRAPTLTTPYLNATRLLQTGYFREAAKAIARAYPDKTPRVCSLARPEKISFKALQVYKTPLEGVFYNKVPKAASSTLAGINRRIAVHWGHRLYGTNGSMTITPHDPSSSSSSFVLTPRAEWVKEVSCTHREVHVVGAGRFYGNRVDDQSFLWGSLRDPAARALSRVFFFQISQGGFGDDDQTILSILKGSNNPQTGCVSKGRGGFQLQYLALTALDDWVAWGKNFPTKVQRPDLVEEQVRNVTQQYDFLAVTERMDESVVALQFLLGLNVGDVLSTSAKVGGAFDYHGKERGCVPIQKAHASPVVRDYLESDEWQALNYGDYLLYAAANRSLDLTIDRLGRHQFDKALQMYRAAMTVVSEECASETFFPCSREGIPQVDLAQSSCYNGDEGCGYRCIDRLVHERGW